jgi:hypothetical protein
MIGIFEIGIIMMMVPVCIMILGGLMASLLIGTILVIASGV